MTRCSRIVFDTEVASTPYDRDGHLTTWRLAGGAGYPAAATGLTGPARAFDGSAGYEAEDLMSVHGGLRAFAVRILCQPDFAAMAGTTATLVARGRGGASAGQYWPWLVRLVVDGGGASADLEFVWQDDAGVAEVVTLATLGAPLPDTWLALTIARETPATTSHCRAMLNGESIGASTSAASITATPGELVTIGCRRNGAAFDQFFIGLIDSVELRDAGVTAMQERHAYLERVVLPELALAAARGYWFEGGFELHGSLYERYRLLVVARIHAAAEAAYMRRAEAGLPDEAYDARLELWEAALDLDAARNLTLDERQQRARATVALVEGLSDAALRAAAAAILGVDTGDVTIQVCPSDLVHDLKNSLFVYASDIGARSQIQGARVSGNMSATWTGAACQIEPVSLVTPSIYLGPSVEEGGGLCEWAVDPSERVALTVTIRPDLTHVPTTTRWIGLTMRRGQAACYLAPFLSAGTWLLRFAKAPGDGSYELTTLGLLPASASGAWNIALLYEDTLRPAASCPLRARVKAAEDGIDDWVDYDVPDALSDSPEWMGFGLAQTLATVDVRAYLTGLRLQWRDHATSFAWTAVVPSLSTDPVAAALSLQRKSRASARASYSQDSHLQADSSGSFADYTPTVCNQE